jgi:hypothetical protein
MPRSLGAGEAGANVFDRYVGFGFTSASRACSFPRPSRMNQARIIGDYSSTATARSSHQRNARLMSAGDGSRALAAPSLVRPSAPRHEAYSGGMLTLAERQRRLARVRLLSHIEIALAATAVLIVLAVWLLPEQPYHRNHVNVGTFPAAILLRVGGALGVFVGSLWLLRIRYRGPEDGKPSSWRSGSN